MLLRDRLCRAQGELPARQEAVKAPYDRQPMPKGRAGAVAGQMQGPQAPAQQYYQQVTVFWQLLQDIVLGFRSMMQRALCFLLSWGHSGALRCTFQATRGANDRCCSSISADALFIPHLEIPLTPCQAVWV